MVKMQPDNGKGITQKNLKDLLNSGADVITSGNHIWDQKEISDVIDKEKRLIRPENFLLKVNQVTVMKYLKLKTKKLQ